MICLHCGSPTNIYNSRATKQRTQTWRRHRCSQCQRCFTTRETVDWDGVTTVKTDDGKLPYSHERLFLSLIRAASGLSLPPGTLSELCDTIEHQLQREDFFMQATSDSSTIRDNAIQVLHRYNPNLALQYVNNTYNHNPPPALLKTLLEL